MQWKVGKIKNGKIFSSNDKQDLNCERRKFWTSVEKEEKTLKNVLPFIKEKNILVYTNTFLLT